MTLRCNPCGRSVTASTFSVPQPLCAYCGARDWRNVDEVEKPYTLTGDDRRFLRSLRITQDADPPTEA